MTSGWVLPSSRTNDPNTSSGSPEVIDLSRGNGGLRVDDVQVVRVAKCCRHAGFHMVRCATPCPRKIHSATRFGRLAMYGTAGRAWRGRRPGQRKNAGARRAGVNRRHSAPLHMCWARTICLPIPRKTTSCLVTGVSGDGAYPQPQPKRSRSTCHHLTTCHFALRPLLRQGSSAAATSSR